MTTLRSLLLVAIFGLNALPVWADSQLGRFEERLESQEPTDDEKNCGHCDDTKAREEAHRKWRQDHPGEPEPFYADESLGDTVFGELIKAAVYAPFALPYYGLKEDHRRPFGYQVYPFADKKGYTVEEGRSWVVTAGGAQHFLPGGAYGVRGDLKATFLHRWTFEAAHTRYNEPLNTQSEFLSFTEALGTFIFARNENVEFRAGAGYQHVEGAGNYDGLKMVYRTRVFLNPVRFDLDMGATFGTGEVLLELRPAVALHWRRAEISLGYRRTSVRGEKIQGPEVGLAVWF